MAGPGVKIERRDILLLAAGRAALLAAPAMGTEGPNKDFRAMMGAIKEIANELPLTQPPDQSAYITRVAARAMLVADYPTPAMGAMGRSGVEFGTLARTDPPTDIVHGIMLVSYRMAPFAVLEPHNHPNYSVATLGLEGEARVTHYEIEGAPLPFTSRETFSLRRTAERILRAREATTLTPARDNIHTFVAGPQGARFVDLFSLHGRAVGFSYLKIKSLPTLPGGDRFLAAWIGGNPSNM